LKERLEEFNSMDSGVPSDVKTAVQDALAGLPSGLDGVVALSQSLHGFHQALLMRRNAYQFPPVDPFSPGTSGVLLHKAHFNDANSTPAWQIGRNNSYSPVPSGVFAPVRAGFVTLSELSVIDVFGQKKRLPKTVEIALPGSMQPEPGSKVN